MLHKPQAKADLLPPFYRIGEPDWDTKLRRLLEAYDVPLPQPIPIDAIVQREQALQYAFPTALRLFLTTFGAIDFDDPRLLLADRIDTCKSLWFHDNLAQAEQRRLPSLLQVAETGSDNFYAIDLSTQHCWLCSHHPAGLFDVLPSFDDLIRMAVIDLSWSRYGWPDPAIEELAVAVKKDIFNW